MKSILTVMGTRPEAIKLAPILKVIDRHKNLTSKVCVTRQHTHLLDPLLTNLNIQVNHHLKNDHGGTLHDSAASILIQMRSILMETKPDIVLVQGDTTTAFAAALAAFYACIPVAHVEAGLRTGQLDSPWPEEAHRCLIDRISTYYFAPTQQAQNTLISEGIAPEKIWVVGNTSIDAVRNIRKSENKSLTLNVRTILVTIHRRENQGKPLEEICNAIRFLAEQFADIRIIFFLHPNPAICHPIKDMLSGITNIDLIEPLDHFTFLEYLHACFFVVTDSGGVQEEAPMLGKPVVILRDTTERPEGVIAGTAKLVGTKAENIIACCKDILENIETFTAMSKIHFPYGDGYAAERIVTILDRECIKKIP